MVFTLSGSKQGRSILYISKKRRCSNISPHIKVSESNSLNTSNSDNVTVNSNLPRIKVQTEISFNTLINLQKETDTESSISINDKIMDKTYINE